MLIHFTSLETMSANNSSSTESEQRDNNFNFIFDSCVILVGIFTNGFIILTFALRRKLRTVTNYFVVNLAVSDFIVLLELILYLLSYRFRSQINIPRSIYFNIITSFLALGMSASPASLVMVSFDRYYAISEPLRYNYFFTHRRAITIIVGIWIYAFIMYLINWGQLVFRNYPSYPEVLIISLAVGNFVVPLCSVTFFYCHILKISLSHLRSTTTTRNWDSNSELSIRRKQFRIALNVFSLIFPLLIIWSTYYGFQLMYLYYCKQCDREISPIVQQVVGTLPHLCAAINPITYILLTKDFREIITSQCRECNSIARRANSEFGFRTENLQLSSMSYISQCNGTYKMSSM